MSATQTVSIKIASFCVSVQSLVDAQKLNSKQLLEAVNSALGQLKATGESDLSMRLKIKAVKDHGDVITLTEKAINKFAGPASSPLRLALFDAEMAKLEKAVGVITLSDWPAWIKGWADKFTAE